MQVTVALWLVTVHTFDTTLSNDHHLPPTHTTDALWNKLTVPWVARGVADFLDASMAFRLALQFASVGL